MGEGLVPGSRLDGAPSQQHMFLEGMAHANTVPTFTFNNDDYSSNCFIQKSTWH